MKPLAVAAASALGAWMVVLLVGAGAAPMWWFLTDLLCDTAKAERGWMIPDGELYENRSESKVLAKEPAHYILRLDNPHGGRLCNPHPIRRPAHTTPGRVRWFRRRHRLALAPPPCRITVAIMQQTRQKNYTTLRHEHTQSTSSSMSPDTIRKLARHESEWVTVRPRLGTKAIASQVVYDKPHSGSVKKALDQALKRMVKKSRQRLVRSARKTI